MIHRSLATMLCWLALVPISFAADANVDLPRFPSISPDGSQIVFSWRGDLWKTSSKGGVAERLTSHPLDDLNSAWSRDGKRIAFSSTRVGGSNFFIMNADGTGIRQVTQTDRQTALVGFGTDDDGNEVLTATGLLEPESYRSPRPYLVRTAVGSPPDFVRVHDAYGMFPVVSPDGKKVLFNRGTSSWSRRNYRGSDSRDVWLFDRANKSFRQLTKWPGNDGRARWIDNEEYVYASDRADDTVNLYRNSIGADESAARRLTKYNDIDVEDFDISADGRTLAFVRWNKLYTLDLAHVNAQPIQLKLQAAEDESDRYQLKDISRTVSEAALSPDGKTMAYIAFGDLYVRGTDSPRSPTRRVTSKPSRERDIAWSPDSEKIYFVSDDSGIEAIYAASVKKTRADIRKEYEQATGKAPTSQPATRPATGPGPDETAEPAHPDEPGGDGEQLRRRRVEPPGGEPTTAPAGGAARSSSPDRDSEPSRWSDAVAFNIDLVAKSDLGDTAPIPSPDGKDLAFKRGKGKLWILSLPEKDAQPRLLLDAWSEQLDWRWSPDSKYIAYQTEDENYNSDIWIVRADDAPKRGSMHAPSAVNITRHPDNDYDPRWSADGRILAFRSERVNNEFDVWMVYLDKDIEALTPPELDQYYKDAAAAAKKRQPLKPTSRPATMPTTAAASARSSEDRSPRDASTSPSTGSTTDQAAASTAPTTRDRRSRSGSTTSTTRISDKPLDLDDAYLRLHRVTTLSGDERNLELTPAGDKFIFTAMVGWERGLFSQDRDAPQPKRLGAAVNVQHLNFAGDQIVFVDTPPPGSTSARAGVVKLPGGETEYYDIADRVHLDLAAQSVQKFLEASRILGTEYWDETMNGLDWKAVTRKYLELAQAARTSDEFDHVANRLLGELNGSHLGINSPDPANPLQRPFGRLGITSVRQKNGYKVTSVLPDGPADRGKMRLKVNDVITAIDLEPITNDDTLDGMLAGKTDKEVVVTLMRDGKELAALFTPVTYEKLGDLEYNHWRRENARKVDELSGGKLGYIHILSMSQPSLDVFERDLYAAAEGKAGLIIDVRNNGGGFTADRLLTSIMYPRHAYTQARGQPKDQTDGYPQDRLFIQRYDRPIDMLCNEKSFSNAEIIAHAFKTLKRGTLVGQTTAGGVISTGGTSLLDGTTVRIPGRAWYLPDGTNMERHGAEPDLIVPQTPEDEVKNQDAQLRAAVEDLMKRVK